MADNDNFHAPAHDLPEETQPAADSAGNATEAPPPERLRVHSLARVLGTTSRRIIDALVELDGRARSAHSTVGREEADRVRQALAEAESSEAVAGDAAAEPSVDEAAARAARKAEKVRRRAEKKEARRAKGK